MDGHGVLALIAPRYCAIADAWTDFEGDSTFADEMGVQAASEVYRLLKARSAPRCSCCTGQEEQLSVSITHV